MVAASFDETKVHIGPCSMFGNSSIYYDGVLVGDVLKADARYRGAVFVAQHDSVSFEFDGVTLSVLSGETSVVVPEIGTSIFLGGENIATTGQSVFARNPAGNCALDSTTAPDTATTWSASVCGMLKAVFVTPTDYVAIDAIFDDDDAGILSAYDSSGQLLQQAFGSGDGRGSIPFVTLTLSRANRDIAFVLAGGFQSEGIYLDNLRFQSYSAVSEPETLGLLGGALLCLVWSRRSRRPSAAMA